MMVCASFVLSVVWWGGGMVTARARGYDSLRIGATKEWEGESVQREEREESAHQTRSLSEGIDRYGECVSVSPSLSISARPMARNPDWPNPPTPFRICALSLSLGWRREADCGQIIFPCRGGSAGSPFSLPISLSLSCQIKSASYGFSSFAKARDCTTLISNWYGFAEMFCKQGIFNQPPFRSISRERGGGFNECSRHVGYSTLEDADGEHLNSLFDLVNARRYLIMYTYRT